MEKLNQWLTLAANLGVLAGLVFLALEIQQNTSAINRQAEIERTSRIMQPYIQDVATLYERVKAVDGEEPEIGAFEERYDFSTKEAVSWVAFLQSSWRTYESDFSHLGPSAGLEADIAYMLSFPDNQLFWAQLKKSFDEEFVEYVDTMQGD